MFNIRELDNIETFSGRISYCKENLYFIQGGSGRMTFDLNDGNVLKLAHNDKGLAQNRVESTCCFVREYDHLFNVPIESHHNNQWNICKKMDKVSKKELEAFVEMDFRTFQRLVVKLNIWVMSQGRSNLPDINTDLLNEMHKLAANYNMLVSDFKAKSSYGKDPDSGKIRIIDYGLTKEVYQEFYLSPREIGFTTNW